MYSSLVLLSPRAARPPQVSLVSRRRLITRKLLIARCSCLDAREHLLRRLDREVDVLLRVLEPGEPSLVLRRREVDALLEHPPVPPRELVRVRVGGVGEVLHRPGAEKEAKHPADVPAAHLVPGRLARLEDAVDELRRHLVHVLVRAVLAENLERLDAGDHRERVTRQRARLIHRPRGGDHLHDLPLAAVRADGHAAADDLAHRREVRGHAPVLLRAPLGDPEPGHDLVEAQQRAVRRRDFAEALEKRLIRDDEPGVTHDGLEDHARDLTLILLEDLLHRVEVVVRRAQRRVRRRLRDAGGIRKPEGRDAGASLHEERVRVAVVAPLELDDLVASGVRAHDAKHGEARLRAVPYKAMSGWS
eukprot:31264-Pelagococcus_subviridis.AAC.11